MGKAILSLISEYFEVMNAFYQLKMSLSPAQWQSSPHYGIQTAHQPGPTGVARPKSDPFTLIQYPITHYYCLVWGRHPIKRDCHYILWFIVAPTL